MNDYGKPQNDKTQQDEQAHDLIEQLNLLEAVDRRITPEHVAKRFHELLDDIGDDGPPSPAADQHPRGILDQPGCGPPFTEYTAEHWADLLGLSGSLEAAIAATRSAADDIIADAQLKAKTVSDELRRTQEAVADARLQAEQIVADARAEADEALERAVKMIRDAGEQAAQIISGAHKEAEQILAAARNQQVNQPVWAGYGSAPKVFWPPAERLTADIRNFTDRTFRVLIDFMGRTVTAEVTADQYPYPTNRADLGGVGTGLDDGNGIVFVAGHGSRQTVGGLTARVGELFGLADSVPQSLVLDPNTFFKAYSDAFVRTAAAMAPTLQGITAQYTATNLVDPAFYHAFDQAVVYDRVINVWEPIPELGACRGARLIGVGSVEGTVSVRNLATGAKLRVLANGGDEYAARRQAEAGGSFYMPGQSASEELPTEVAELVFKLVPILAGEAVKGTVPPG